MNEKRHVEQNPSLYLDCGRDPFTIARMKVKVRLKRFNKHKEPTYFIDYHWRGNRIKIYTDRNGNSFTSKERAEYAAGKIADEIVGKTHDPSKHQPKSKIQTAFFHLADEYVKRRFEDAQSGIIDLSQAKKVRSAFDIFKEFFLLTDIVEIRALHLERLLKESLLKKGWSLKTVKNHLDILKTFFVRMYDNEVIERTPKFPSVGAIPQRARKWLEPQMQSILISHIRELHRPVFTFLAWYGTRPGEARALQVKDIDFTRKTIMIQRAFSENRLKEFTKTKRERAIPLLNDFVPMLRDFVKDKTPEAFVFINPNTGRPYTMSCLEEEFDRARTAASMQGITLYEFSRHSVASQIVNSSETGGIIAKEILGHTDIRTTLSYAHPHLNTMVSAMEKSKNAEIIDFEPRHSKRPQ